MESAFFKDIIRPSEKSVILQFLCEQGIACFFYFQPKAHEFFSDSYPTLYGSVESGSHLLTAEGELHLVGAILRVPNGNIIVQKKTIWSGDGNMPSCLLNYVCPRYKDGVTLTFPINLIRTIATTPLRCQ